jgi:hypothetical protein
MGGGAVKPGDIAIEVVGFVVRMVLAVCIFCSIDHTNGRRYEQAMGAGMIFLLMNSDRGGKA